MAVDLEQELDDLYAADLDEFVARRDELAKRLRDEGRRDEADDVHRTRKPPVSAWAANQLAHSRRKHVDLLLDAGHRLREGQRSALSGGGATELERARRAQRKAVAELVEAGRTLLEERRGTAAKATLDRLASTLRAASADDRARELLARGRLPDDVDPAGFEALEPMAELLREAGRDRENARAKRRERERLEQSLRDARDRARELAREADRLEREAARARRKADDATAEATEAERRLEEAGPPD